MMRASLIAQLVRNLPAMQETLVRFLGWEDPLEKGKATHSSILAWRIPWAVQTRLGNFHTHIYTINTLHTHSVNGSESGNSVTNRQVVVS